MMRGTVFVLLAAVGGGSLAARTLTVSPAGGGGFTSISAAAEVAGPGDMVLVEPLSLESSTVAFALFFKIDCFIKRSVEVETELCVSRSIFKNCRL